MMIRILLYLFICLSFQSLVAQQDLSLSQAIKIGLRNTYQIQIAEKDLEIARNNNTWKNTGKFPTIDFLLSNQNSFFSANDPTAFLPDIATIGSGLNGTLDLNWTLFDGHKVKINKKRLDELERQGIANLELAVEQTVQEVILAYYNSLIQKDQLDVLEEILVISKDRVGVEEIKKQYGQAGTFEILQTQDALLNDSTNYLTQQYLYENSMRNLKLAMGENKMDKRYRLTDTLGYEAQQYSFKELERKMVNENRSLKLLEANRSLAAVERDFQESNKAPTVTLGAGANQNFSKSQLIRPSMIPGMPTATDVVDRRNFSGYINLGLSYRIWDNGARRRGVENAKLEETIAQLSIDEQRQQLSTELRNTLETYNSQLELIKVAERLMINAVSNIEIAKERFRAGTINSFDYRSIQLSYINASQNRLNAIFNLKNTETELIRLTGGLVGQ